MEDKTEVLIIGGGVIGASIARELSKYQLDIMLVEKESDVADGGPSKANTALIHAGFNADSNKLKGQLNVKGNKMYDQLTEELNVPFERNGAMVVAQKEEEITVLEEILENGKRNGVSDLEIITGKRIFELEPNLNNKAIAALYAPTAGIICPYELTIALAQNAAVNGANILLETEVLDIEIEDDYKIVQTNKGEIKAKIVINAAGLYSDKIAKMVGIDDFEIIPRKGEYYVYDKKLGDEINHTIFQVPTGVSKGVVVTPTVDGNLLVGPNAEEIENKDDVSTTQPGLDEVFQGAQKTLPSLSKHGVINQFAGLRPAYKDTSDFIIEASEKVDGFINVAGIQSPGLSCAPAIADLVVDLVNEVKEGLTFAPDFDPYREEPVRFRELSPEKQADLIKEDNRYGQIICRCETVTKGEIIDAIQGPVGARSVRAVRRRTRAGMGRCQGGFCGPKVVEILAEELGLSPVEITEKGKGSDILVDKTKAPLLREVNKGE
ncbi:NAD(P)/FAD-dependent oxidoreductase [Sporohalobacter salinus]|uniref:NAD(P)/FAD-dependent oxidoreductase n=1 Tax=Sporohalobacter salinus TaxID=1494606 RepID=UPI00196005BB|nr:NAD(P)/FAD-dependent oxidoreductase [Sporohalobacter salinus]MBM7622712.1 glycerol-3-phosphate dehydrogenase [Sporohalobacter salinus]